MKKISLQSLIFSFILSIAIFEKSTYQQSASFPQATLFMKFTTGKSKQASFQIVLRIGMYKRITFLQLQNYYPLSWKMKSSKEVYFINNITLFSRVYWFIGNLLEGIMIKILYFQ